MRVIPATCRRVDELAPAIAPRVKVEKLVEARRALSRSPLRARVVRPSDMSPIPSRRSWPFASVDADDVRVRDALGGDDARVLTTREAKAKYNSD